MSAAETEAPKPSAPKSYDVEIDLPAGGKLRFDHKADGAATIIVAEVHSTTTITVS